MIVQEKKYTTVKFTVYTCLTLFLLLCIIPFIAIVSISLSNEMDIVEHGYRLIPADISLMAYKVIFRNASQLLHSYTISIIVTALGTLISLSVIALLSYPLSRPDFKYKNHLAFYVFFTMLFNGGLVPWYILITRYLHLKNTIWVLIFPYVVIPWFVLLLRTFFQQIPLSIIESAKIDGASELRTFVSIVLPLSKPALATIGLFIALRYWNDWWLSLLYIDVESLIPLQYMLYRMMSNIEFLTRQMNALPMGVDMSNMPTESARMAMCILAAGPMLFVFPFFQKYFVKGITAGALKG